MMQKDPIKKLGRTLKVLFWIWIVSLVVGLGLLAIHPLSFDIVIIGFYYWIFAALGIYPLGCIIDIIAIKRYFSLDLVARLPYKKKLITLSILFQFNLLLADFIASFFLETYVFFSPIQILLDNIQI